MIAVVTGAGGFIGSHLVDSLLARGAAVRVITRPGAVPVPRPPGVECHEVELLDESRALASGVWNGATHVFHLAGLTRARNLEQFRAANVRPVANVLAALAALPSPPRFVLVSSQAAAGPARGPHAPVHETDAPAPIEPYGASKLEAEHAATRFAPRVPTVIVRPCAVYGPRDRDFLHAFREACGRVAFYAAPRDQLFSIVHVRDAVDGIVLAAEHYSAPGNTYFLANDLPVTWSALYAGIALAAGSRPLEIQLPAAALRLAALGGNLLGALTGTSPLINSHKLALTAPRWWICSAERARTTLGWSPAVKLHDGLRETYLWYAGAGWLRRRKPPAAARSTEEHEA